MLVSIVPLVGSYVFGLLTALQSRFNGELSVHLANGIEAALFSFGSGLVLSLVILVVGPARRAVMRIPEALRARNLSWWQLLGGIGGGLFVAVQAASVPIVGVAVFTVAVVAGQSANSLIVDRIGLGPAGKQPVTPRRVLSAMVAFTAVLIAVSNRFGTASFSLVAVVACFLVGAATSVQQALNGRITRATGNPTPGTLMNFLVGSAMLAVLFIGNWTFVGHEPVPLGGGPWWAYLGGVVGVVFILIAAWVVPIIGVLVFAVLSIAGQLSCALVLDLVAPTAGSHLGWQLVLGVLLAFGAVVIAAGNRLGARGRESTAAR